MTVKEFIGTLESSDRLRIIEGKAEVYVGYLAAFKPFADHEISEEYRKYSGHEVKKFRAVPEITHRRWKELGLLKPLEPDQTAQYKFTDGALQGKRWNCSKNLVRPEPEYHIISDREYFKKEPKAIKGYYVDKNSVSMGVHSPEYYGYGYLRYTLVKITDRGGLKCR